MYRVRIHGTVSYRAYLRQPTSVCFGDVLRRTPCWPELYLTTCDWRGPVEVGQVGNCLPPLRWSSLGVQNWEGRTDHTYGRKPISQATQLCSARLTHSLNFTSGTDRLQSSTPISLLISLPPAEYTLGGYCQTPAGFDLVRSRDLGADGRGPGQTRYLRQSLRSRAARTGPVTSTAYLTVHPSPIKRWHERVRSTSYSLPTSSLPYQSPTLESCY